MTESPALRVLRLCSVFEVPADLVTRARRFDPVGGMQNHTGELSRALDRRGVAQTIVTTRPPGAPASTRQGRSMEILRVGLPIRHFRQLYAAPALARAWKAAANVDLVHVHLGEDLAILPIATLTARRKRLPLVVTVHCSLRHTLRALDLRTAVLKAVGGWLESRAEARADGVIVLTSRLERLLQAAGRPPERTWLIPPGVNDKLMREPLEDPLPHIGRPRVVFIGRLAPQKGVRTLLDAAAALGSARIEVVIVGDGPERAMVERRAQDMARVHVVGFLSHDVVPAVLAHADVLVLPSLYEELGSVLLEATSAGVPVVASDVGGVRDVVVEGVNGSLVAPGDHQELARAIRRLVMDPALRERLRSGTVSDRRIHSWEEVAERVLDVYRCVLEGRR